MRDRGPIWLWASRYTLHDATAWEIYQNTPKSFWSESDGGFGGEAPDVLQYTDRADIAGFADVDANAYRGSLDEFKNLTVEGNAEGGKDEDVSYAINIFQAGRDPLEPAHFSSRKRGATRVASCGIKLPSDKELKVVRRGGRAQRNRGEKKGTKKEARFSHEGTARRVDADLDQALEHNRSKTSNVLVYRSRPKAGKKPLTA